MLQTEGVRLGMHLLEVEITTRCNLDCAHCYNRDKRTADMPVNTILSYLRFAMEHSVSSFVVSGGEASLHPQFDILAEFLLSNSHGVRIVLQTNGIANRKPIELLRGFNVVHISYEPDESGVRKANGAELIDFGLRLKRERIYAYLFATIHQGNIDMIDAMVETANKVGLDIGFNLCIPLHQNSGLGLSMDQSLAITRKLYGLFLKKRILRFTLPLVAVIKGDQSTRYIGNRGGCTAGIAACSITVDGDVIPCPFFRTVTAGNVYEQRLEKIWLDSPIFKDLRNRSNFDDPCGSCEHLSFCGGCRKRALDLSGNLIGADSGCFKRIL